MQYGNKEMVKKGNTAHHEFLSTLYTSEWFYVWFEEGSLILDEIIYITRS
jgi:hypothetical protein